MCDADFGKAPCSLIGVRAGSEEGQEPGRKAHGNSLLQRVTGSSARPAAARATMILAQVNDRSNIRAATVTRLVRTTSFWPSRPVDLRPRAIGA